MDKFFKNDVGRYMMKGFNISYCLLLLPLPFLFLIGLGSPRGGNYFTVSMILAVFYFLTWILPTITIVLVSYLAFFIQSYFVYLKKVSVFISVIIVSFLMSFAVHIFDKFFQFKKQPVGSTLVFMFFIMFFLFVFYALGTAFQSEKNPNNQMQNTGD